MSSIVLPAPLPAARPLDPGSLDRHSQRLRRVALSLCGSPHDADDLVQEVYVRVLARPRELRGADETGYLLRVLRNTFVSGRRSAARRPAAAGGPEDLERVHARGGDSEQAVEARQLYATIAALPDHQREVLVAVDVVGLSYEEAAGHLGIPLGTVMSRLHRARRAVASA